MIVNHLKEMTDLGNGDSLASRTHHPLDCLNGDAGDIALIHLNTDFPRNTSLFCLLWKKACFRACTDGAVNKLHDLSERKSTDFVPDLISGDFDSAEPAVLQHYKDLGVRIVSTPDQDETDFTKCLRIVLDEINSRKLEVSSIVAYTSFGGRFDHTLGNVDTLYRAAKLSSLPIYLISPDCLSFLLQNGKHILYINKEMRGQHCGLIPVGQPCQHVTTSGLKWNLSDDALQFGTLISTCNEFTSSSEIHVSTDAPLLWTMSLAPLEDEKHSIQNISAVL